jgi:uncharacterized protein (DUF58 family)
MRLRLTLAGWLYLVVAVLIGGGATQGQGPLAFVLFGAMMAMLHISGWVAWRSLRGVDVQRDVSQRVWQHQTVHLGYHMRNLRRRSACLGLEVSELRPQGLDSASGYCVHLPAGGVFRAGARFAARRRGRLRLSAVQLSTVFPFGLVRATRTVAAPAEIIVWPARGKLRRQPLLRGAVETSSAAPSLASGGQDEFFGLREYRPDDSPRWIAWKRSAGRPLPVVREMARPRPEVLYLVVDASDAAHPSPDERERVLRAAATLLDHALSSGYQVGLAVAGPDGSFAAAPAEGSAQRSRLLDALAAVDDSTTGPLDDVVTAIPHSHVARAQVLVLAPQANRLSPAAHARLGQRGQHLDVVDSALLDRLFEDHPQPELDHAD